MSLYYSIWVDVIRREQAKKVQRANWQVYSLVPMSLLMGINLFTFFYWMKVVVSRYLPLIFPLDIFSSRLINAFISIVITFFIPFVILNYLLIFNNERYKNLLAEYKGENGKLYKKYALISIGTLFVPIIIQKMFF